MLCTPKPNGFADHYPVFYGYFIGNIPYFQTNPYGDGSKLTTPPKKKHRDLSLKLGSSPVIYSVGVAHFDLYPYKSYKYTSLIFTLVN